MVKAILDGSKTQTRRLAWRKAKHGNIAEGDMIAINDPSPNTATHYKPTVWQKARPGDKLWVREAFLAVGGLNPERARIVYRATNDGPDAWVSPSWSPSIHMPRWASRLTLTVTETRLQRVQDISGVDAEAEGIEIDFPGGHHGAYKRARQAFRELWDTLNADRAPWDSNPEVVVIGFETTRKNIDAMMADLNAARDAARKEMGGG
jgi:hypothetical protein